MEIGGFFCCCALVAMIIIYIQDLHSNLTTVNIENLKLPNGMHEGLLILEKGEKNEETSKVMFCNSSVKKLLATFMLEDQNNSKSVGETEFMKKQIFQNVKLAKKEQDKDKTRKGNKMQKSMNSSSFSDDMILSLRQIIMI